jgi:hypothetical protein
MRPDKPLTVLALSLTLVTPAAVGAENGGQPGLVFEGRAYKLDAELGDSSALIYTEQHRQTGACEDGRWKPATDSVTYRHPSGEKRGSKEVDYTVALRRPSYTLIDNAFNERIEVTNQNDERALIVYDEYQETELQRYEVPLNNDGVIDAGFDQMVAQRWDALMAGKTVDFEFLVIPRGEMYDFEAAKVDDPKPTKGENVIRIQPEGFFADFFVEPIFLAYDDRGYLTDYMGLGNVRRDSNDNHEVHIRYSYQQMPGCQGH